MAIMFSTIACSCSRVAGSLTPRWTIIFVCSFSIFKVSINTSVDALDVFGKYVRNIHAKDGFYPTNGHDLGKEARIGDGKVDFKALFKKLHELGYDSYVTIEREISGEKQIEDILYAKKYLEDIISEIY
mgnify:CR=1 FL=1